MKDLIIGIDAGTSVIKAIAFELEGRQIAGVSMPNDYRNVDDRGVEQDMLQTWRDTVATLAALAQKVPDLAARAAAIAVTGQGDGTWMIDRDGAPVTGGWLWLDARAGRLVDSMRGGPADVERFQITGTGLSACQQGPQLLWMKQNRRDVLDRAATAFHCKDWLYLRMTGQCVTDPSEGTFTFGDFRTRRYSDTVLEIFDLTEYRHLLPPMLDGTTDHFPLSKEAAAETGLLQGTPVVLGYIDAICTVLGAGLYDRKGGIGCSILGSTGVHTRFASTVEDVVLNEAMSGYVMQMPVPGTSAQLQSNMAATLNIDWFLDLVGNLLGQAGVSKSREDLISILDGWLAETAPASLIYQPYISQAGERGPFVDAEARAGFIGLSTRHGIADMARAVLEGLAFAARDCYSVMGPLPQEVRFSGGAARSRALRSLLAAAIGAPVRTTAREEAGAAGAAMIAAVGLGHYADMDSCAGDWVTPLLSDAESPDSVLSDIYAEAYPAFAEAHEVLRPVWKKLAERKIM